MSKCKKYVVRYMAGGRYQGHSYPADGNNLVYDTEKEAIIAASEYMSKHKLSEPVHVMCTACIIKLKEQVIPVDIERCDDE